METKKKLGIILKNARKKRGLSQTEAGRRLALKQTTISGYEVGASCPDMDTLVRLTDLYDLDITDLMHELYHDIIRLDPAEKLEPGSRELAREIQEREEELTAIAPEPAPEGSFTSKRIPLSEYVSRSEDVPQTTQEKVNLLNMLILRWPNLDPIQMIQILNMIQTFEDLNYYRRRCGNERPEN